VFFRAGPEPKRAPGAAAPINIKPAAAQTSAGKPRKIKKHPKPAET
jgi:hypothetical protein